MSPFITSSSEREILEQTIQNPFTSQNDILRAKIILMRSQGIKAKDIAHELGMAIPTVCWRIQQFQKYGLKGLHVKYKFRSPLDISIQEKDTLLQMIQNPLLSQISILRAKIVLMHSEGKKRKDIAIELNTPLPTIYLWIRQFKENRLKGLHSEPDNI